MNIVFFSRFFYPHIGGVEKHVLQVGKQLQKKHSVTVVTEQSHRSLPVRDNIENISIIRIPSVPENSQKKYHIWDYLFQNRHIIREASVIHAHDVFYWYIPFRFIYPSKKVFVTFHGYEGNGLPGSKAMFWHKTAEILTKGNICIGDYLAKWYKTNPDIVSYGAVSPKKQYKEHTIFKTKKRSIQVLYIGRLEEEAGIMEYLKMVRQLVKKKFRLKLIVLGDGSLRNKAEAYVKKHALPVTFYGFVHDVESFLPGCDVVFTSRYLGTLEAMNYKKPVFCVYNNAIKRDCFVLSPFRDFLFLSDNVRSLVGDFEWMTTHPTEMKQKVHHAYSWVRYETWKKMADHYEDLWTKS